MATDRTFHVKHGFSDSNDHTPLLDKKKFLKCSLGIAKKNRSGIVLVESMGNTVYSLNFGANSLKMG